MLARITFLGSAKGGRMTPPHTGFRPLIQIGDVYTSCFVESTSGDEVFEFDKEYFVSLRLFFPEQYGGRLHPGDAANLFEGTIQIGKGTIVDAS